MNLSHVVRHDVMKSINTALFTLFINGLMSHLLTGHQRNFIYCTNI